MKKIASILLLMSASLLADHPATQPVPREAEWCHNHHVALNAKAKKGGSDVILLGDSITWEWEANKETGAVVWPELAPYRAATFGVSGDRTEHLLWRLQNGNLDLATQPSAFVLMIGTNNIGQRNDPPEAIAAGVDAILKLLQSRYPKATLYLYGIFPTGANAQNAKRRAIADTNLLLQESAKAHGARFIDLTARFLHEDGTLRDELFRDGLHLSSEGYRIWATSLRETLPPSGHASSP